MASSVTRAAAGSARRSTTAAARPQCASCRPRRQMPHAGVALTACAPGCPPAGPDSSLARASPDARGPISDPRGPRGRRPSRAPRSAAPGRCVDVGNCRRPSICRFPRNPRRAENFPARTPRAALEASVPGILALRPTGDLPQPAEQTPDEHEGRRVAERGDGARPHSARSGHKRAEHAPARLARPPRRLPRSRDMPREELRREAAEHQHVHRPCPLGPAPRCLCSA